MKTITIDESAVKKLPTVYTNFSTSVNTQTRLKVLSETKPLLDAHHKCKEIWHALQIADYKKEGTLNDAALKILIEKQGKNISDLLLIKTPEEMLELLDEDEDGFLNEDEQILIFSTIKERMQLCSEELCKIHEYGLYKDIMKSIRMLEDDINSYQKVLRARSQEKELNAYYEIGEEKLKKFNEDWENKFEEFENDCQARMQEMLGSHQTQLQELELDLQKDSDILKIKPKAILKTLQVKEKLVAINERYAEAQTIRNELKSLEIQEQNRVEQFIAQEHEKKIKNLKKHQEKEIEFTLLKNKAAYNKLIIKKEQEKIKLDKQIKLHLNDITKGQNIASALANKLAKTRDELRRTKIKSKKVQEYLSEAKSIKTRRKSTEILPHVTQTAGTKPKFGIQSVISNSIGYRSVSPLKKTLNNVTKFKIKSDSLKQDTPVNVVPDFLNNSSIAARAGKLLQQFNKHTKALPALTSLYDSNLEPVQI